MPPEKDDVLVRLRADRNQLLRRAAELLQKQTGRKVIQNPEAIEKLAQYYLAREGK